MYLTFYDGRKGSTSLFKMAKNWGALLFIIILGKIPPPHAPLVMNIVFSLHRLRTRKLQLKIILILDTCTIIVLHFAECSNICNAQEKPILFDIKCNIICVVSNNIAKCDIYLIILLVCVFLIILSTQLIPKSSWK